MQEDLKYHRILLKLSGEALAGTGAMASIPSGRKISPAGCV